MSRLALKNREAEDRPWDCSHRAEEEQHGIKKVKEEDDDIVAFDGGWTCIY
jgi:hypothetical protein